MAFLTVLDGYKTYLVAAAMVGLGMFQLSIGQIPQGMQTLFSALAAAGLRGSIAGLKSRPRGT